MIQSGFSNWSSAFEPLQEERCKRSQRSSNLKSQLHNFSYTTCKYINKTPMWRSSKGICPHQQCREATPALTFTFHSMKMTFTVMKLKLKVRFGNFVWHSKHFISLLFMISGITQNYMTVQCYQQVWSWSSVSSVSGTDATGSINVE